MKLSELKQMVKEEYRRQMSESNRSSRRSGIRENRSSRRMLREYIEFNTGDEAKEGFENLSIIENEIENYLREKARENKDNENSKYYMDALILCSKTFKSAQSNRLKLQSQLEKMFGKGNGYEF